MNIINDVKTSRKVLALVKSIVIHLSLDLSEQWVPENPRINRIRTNRGYIYVVMRSKAINLDQNNQIFSNYYG